MNFSCREFRKLLGILVNAIIFSNKYIYVYIILFHVEFGTKISTCCLSQILILHGILHFI